MSSTHFNNNNSNKDDNRSIIIISLFSLYYIIIICTVKVNTHYFRLDHDQEGGMGWMKIIFLLEKNNRHFHNNAYMQICVKNELNVIHIIIHETILKYNRFID